MSKKTATGWMRARRGAACVMACLCVVYAAFADDGGTTLKLRDEVYVKGPVVVLGDLAEIAGTGADALAAIEVTTAALPGGTKSVTASYLASRIRRAELAEEPEISGAERVSIITESKTISPQVIAENLREHILLEMPWDLADAEVTVTPPTSELVVSDGEIEIQWRPSSSYRYLGTGAFTGAVRVDGRSEKIIQVKANVLAYGHVLVAARDIPRGRLVSMQDIEVREQPLSEAGSSAITRLEDAVGLLTRRTIFPGQTLSSRDLEAPLVIRRNQLVNVELRSGGLLIQTRAKAMSDGRAGDPVLCANPVTKKQFQGVARADGTVAVE